ncbi:hypothetical protein [Mucilaginibacter sp.]|uniref:hypothetical protein n=1 Tax=Mucilaginibacter sp. TaxID=1882438 RepID=UPI002609BC29|nr:hypothetical protein [Mucilaginibacter sp.]MDB4926451.1 hypothetical protein [Mucilaginibacter sp.]
MKKYLIIPCLLITLKLAAQDPVVIQQQKMKDAQLLSGTWAGEGWIIMPDGKKHMFNQTEKVVGKMDGALLTIEGNGKDSETGKSIHNAFAILTYDNGKQAYRWTAVSSGYLTDVVPDVYPGGFTWSLRIRTGTIRYTISYTANEWIEKGDVSTDDGKSWVQNFEMHLKKS